MLQKKRPDEANCAEQSYHCSKAVEREDTDTQQGNSAEDSKQKTLCDAVMDAPGVAAAGGCRSMGASFFAVLVQHLMEQSGIMAVDLAVVVRIGDALCENLDSRRKPITASEREAGIYPYYGASGVVDYVADYLFDEDILLVSEDGANLLMRSTPIAFSVSGKVWVNNHAHVVRFEKMSMQKYIEVFFSMIDISEHITGSAQPKLDQAKLNTMMFPVPNDDRLEAFLSFVEQTDKSKLVIRKSMNELETLKKALMQKYFG